MDIIDEEKSSFGDFVDVPASSNGYDGVATMVDDAITESSETSTDYDDDADDFASRLKLHRKQLMAGDGRPKKQEDFSQKLRKHRDGLITTWEHVEDHTNDRAIQNGIDDHVDDVTNQTQLSISSEGLAESHGSKSSPRNEGFDNQRTAEVADENDDFGQFEETKGEIRL